MDHSEERWDLLLREMQAINSGFSLLIRCLSMKNSIDSIEFIQLCTFLRDIRVLTAEFEDVIRIKPAEPDYPVPDIAKTKLLRSFFWKDGEK